MSKMPKQIPLMPLVPACPPGFSNEWGAVVPQLRAHPITELWIEITPEIADHWLETRNTKNRPIRAGRVDAIARDIRAGNYELTHQGVAFDVDGVLADGQHRLSAIVATDTPLVTRVSFGLSKTAIRAIDTNIGARRHGDIFSIEGISNGKARASIARSLVILETRDGKNVSFSQVESTYNRFKDAIVWASGVVARGRVNTTVAGALAYAWSVYPDQTSAIGKAVSTLVGISEGSPAQALRTVIEGPRIRVTDGKTKTLTGDDYTLCMMLKTLRCCEMHVKGLSLKKVYDTEEGFRFFKAERSKRGLD